MKTLLLTAIIFYSSSSRAQTRVPIFEVAAGKTRTLSFNERYIIIDRLSLGNNSTIIVPPEMDGWTIIANEALIGNDVKILASGSPGVDGAAGFPGENGTKGSFGPTGGSIGGRGDNGRPGKNIHLKLTIRSLGSLTVIANGGAGGKGGQGGIGGKGADGYCIFSSSETVVVAGQDGASGGRGGHGGNGGDGGKVRIEYHLSPGVSVPEINSRFLVSCSGGPAGAQGRAGAGGTPGSGTKCKGKKSNPGTHGPPGKDWDAEKKYAREGERGRVEIIAF